MKVLVVGGGGREHTLVWKLAQEIPLVQKVFAAPGNAGISEIAECVPIGAEDIKSLGEFALKERIDLTVVGPEIPLTLGIVDEFQKKGLMIFGPSRQASQIEGSKAFCKNLLKKYEVPSAHFEVFTDYERALSYVKSRKRTVWIKANGLTAGKGAIPAHNLDEAEEILHRMMVERVFGESGDTVVIEDNLVGEETSVLAITDGENFIPMVSSQDHKRIGDGDTGPNTGGMGAYAPAPVTAGEMIKRISDEILRPTIQAMAEEGTPYHGVLYAGLMINEEGPSVVEFNCRFGDPESQVVLPLMESSLADLLIAACEGNLGEKHLQEKDDSAVCVVMASGGYPGFYEKGFEITGLEEAKGIENVVVFHAGTKREDNRIVTSGGRVLGVTGVAGTFSEARNLAYQAVEKIHFEKAYWRKDIGYRAIERLEHS